MKTQTSIDWLIEQHERLMRKYVDVMLIKDSQYHDLKNKLIQTARQMHREEVEYGYRVGLEDGVDNTNGETPLYRNASEYYSQIFQTSISI